MAQEAIVHTFDGQELQPGWSLDLTRQDPRTGEAWDLSLKSVQERVRKMVRQDKPLFLIGSPPCTAFSTLQNLSEHKRDPKVVAAEREAAEQHLKFCMSLYMLQVKEGRCFIHEHPAYATSWAVKEVVQLLAEERVDVAEVDMCCYGMVAKDQDGREGPAKKRTKIMSNSVEVLKRIAIRCPNNDPSSTIRHEHVPLESGRAKKCQVYPREFCARVVEGIAAEKRVRALGLRSMPLMSVEDSGACEALHEPSSTWATDDLSGEALDPSLVRAARKEEIQYFKSMKVYDKVDTMECWEATGKGPIAVRWVDINKGDRSNPNYRSRLVAKEYKTEERPEWFAATPPGECLKILLSKMASNKKLKMLYADVSRAYFYAAAVRPVYVKLAEEDREAGDDGKCGRLRVSMYGTRDAALNWSLEYAETLKSAGYKQGLANPCLFHHAEKDVTVMVHGDDFAAVGGEKHIAETEKTLRDKCKIKTEKLGSGESDSKEIKV